MNGFKYFFTALILLLSSKSIYANQYSISVNAGWNFISIPYVTEVKNAITFFNAAHVCQYNPTTGMVCDNGIEQLTRTNAYFVKYDSATTLSFFASTPIYESPICNTLNVGWNAVGVPFAEGITWYDGIIQVGTNVLSATTDIQKTVYIFPSGEYKTVDIGQVMQAFNGYWVYANNNVQLCISKPIDNPWITIPEDDFVMGCADADTQCKTDEKPKHTVHLKAFKIQRYEVTNAQYMACVTAGVCTPPISSTSRTRTLYYGDAAYNNYPVIAVGWNQAKTYCGWILGRLPTEAEWEKAARGPSSREVIYPWGNNTPTCSLANGYYNSNYCLGDTNEVGSYPTGASYYGILDLAGNVSEWIEDDYHDNYVGAPTDGSAWVDNPRSPYRIIRGCSMFCDSENLRISDRNSSVYTFSNDVFQNRGFRCVQNF
jgi:formylglycine-generating enzyme required for sulfatase activity